MKPRNTLFVFLYTASLADRTSLKPESVNVNRDRARQALHSIYANYTTPETYLLRENCPFDDRYTATYLASAEEASIPNLYSFLWPYSGTFSAVNALLEATQDKKDKDFLDTRVLAGLEEYLDEKRVPYAYSSYIRTAAPSDRFYDDNIWIGIDFTDTYLMTKEPHYLKKAKMIWTFIESGTDKQLGGGIYWCEQQKKSKNTCSNAPAAVFALKLFKATADSVYSKQGKELYQWTKTHLQDPTDGLYFDNIRLDGKINKPKTVDRSNFLMTVIREKVL